MAVGLIYIVVSTIIHFTGKTWLEKLLPPVVIGPMIMVIGLGLAPNAVSQMGLAGGEFQWEVILVAVSAFLITAIVMTMAKGFLKVIPFLIGIAGGYIVAVIVGLVDFAPVVEAAWFNIPSFVVPFVHYTPNFSALITIAPPANTTYGENTSVVGLTKVASVWVIGLAAIIAIVIGFLGKFTALVQTIPNAVLGGVSLLLYGFIAVNGLKVLIKNQINFDDPKNVVVASSMLVLGLGGAVISIISGDLAITISGMSLAAVVGILLNLILPAQKSETTKKSNGKKKETVKA